MLVLETSAVKSVGVRIPRGPPSSHESRQGRTTRQRKARSVSQVEEIRRIVSQPRQMLKMPRRPLASGEESDPRRLERTNFSGRLVKWENISLAPRRWGFDSAIVHQSFKSKSAGMLANTVTPCAKFQQVINSQRVGSSHLFCSRLANWSYASLLQSDRECSIHSLGTNFNLT